MALRKLLRFAKGSPFGGTGTRCLRGSLRQRLHQAAVGDDLLDKGREGFGLEGLAGGLVGDDAGVEVHMDLVACGDGVGGFGALHDGQADVDAVAVEDAGKALGDDHRDAGGLDGQRGVLTGGAAAEVPAADHDVASASLTAKSANILRLTSTPALAKPAMKRL